MGIHTLVQNPNKHETSNRSSFRLCSSLCAANRIDDAQAKGSAALDDAVGKAQQVLDSNNIDLNLSEITSNLLNKAQKEIESRQLKQEANNLAEQGRQAIKDKLNNSGLSQGVKKNLLNLLKNVEAEARKALNE